MEKSTSLDYYIVGPMRGYPLFNFPAFIKMAKSLRDAGYTVCSPAEMDIERGFNPITNPDQQPFETLAQCMERDLAAVARAKNICVLNGWEKSEGSLIELRVALSLNKPIFDEIGLPMNCAVNEHFRSRAERIIGRVQLDGSFDGEVSVVDKSTGGTKGQKLERFDLIPVWPLQELARVYGKGWDKYPHPAEPPWDNWRRGYSWRLSFAALCRHAWLFWCGESIDACNPGCPPDCKIHTNLHHLACAAWHCFTLMWFERNKAGTDDRADTLKGRRS